MKCTATIAPRDVEEEQQMYHEIPRQRGEKRADFHPFFVSADELRKPLYCRGDNAGRIIRTGSGTDAAAGGAGVRPFGVSAVGGRQWTFRTRSLSLSSPVFPVNEPPRFSRN
jgi:hypothetical protein